MAQYSAQYSARESLYTTCAGIAEKCKAPLPGKEGHRSREPAVKRAWAIPALHLSDLSKASDISREHSSNAAQSVHCVRNRCYIGGKEKLSHILLCTDDVGVFEQIIYRLYDKPGALFSTWAEFQFCRDGYELSLTAPEPQRGQRWVDARKKCPLHGTYYKPQVCTNICIDRDKW